MPSFASRRLRVALGIAVVLAGLAAFGLWLRDSSFVRVQAVTITGIDGRQAAEIRDALTVAALDMTTLAVDDDALRRSVASYPVVRNLRSAPDYPRGLRIVVESYEPIAQLQAGGSYTPVAADGTLLRGCPTKGLAVIGVKARPGGDRVGDADTLRAIGLVHAAPAPLRRRIARVFRGTRGFAATVEDGPKLYFGGGERLRAQWAAAAQVLSHRDSQGARYVDLRIPDRPVAGGFGPRTDKDSVSTLG